MDILIVKGIKNGFAALKLKSCVVISMFWRI
jgi:hypothetical protein